MSSCRALVRARVSECGGDLVERYICYASYACTYATGQGYEIRDSLKGGFAGARHDLPGCTIITCLLARRSIRQGKRLVIWLVLKCLSQAFVSSRRLIHQGDNGGNLTRRNRLFNLLDLSRESPRVRAKFDDIYRAGLDGRQDKRKCGFFIEKSCPTDRSHPTNSPSLFPLLQCKPHRGSCLHQSLLDRAGSLSPDAQQHASIRVPEEQSTIHHPTLLLLPPVPRPQQGLDPSAGKEGSRPLCTFLKSRHSPIYYCLLF